jgi:hypothetical protein
MAMHTAAVWTRWQRRLRRRTRDRLVRSTFATVPFYRALWALDGRTDPVLVPGRTGARDGATPSAQARRHVIDLVPLAGGDAEIDPCRGLGPVLTESAGLGAGDLVVVLDPAARHAPADLPAGARGCLLAPDRAGDEPAAFTALVNAARGGGRVLVVGADKELALLDAALPEDVAPRLTRIPRRELDQLDAGPYGVLHDPVLGYYGALGSCGRWHPHEAAVLVRETRFGLAFSLPRQHSPRLVDILPAAADQVQLGRCPRHDTEVIVPVERDVQ